MLLLRKLKNDGVISTYNITRTGIVALTLYLLASMKTLWMLIVCKSIHP